MRILSFDIMKLKFLYQKRFEGISYSKGELANYVDYYKTRPIKVKLKLGPEKYRTQFVQTAYMK